ncbi:CRISPR-associated helicase, Cas3 family [Raineyella antarctica]|uniref:CRISPR-associated helicase, Cas3 family n=1 Tax=Raineyella antarctica TaxID=1577474 RepID=A0A1G6H633_9ACTN|nr:CRISPR-associated helicase/endonuclease Cas3 [Raineyella antarctica]SDB89702.1 CRISPR-associated helicase, Cas3 family [Raineyella antarctica]
MAGGLAEATRTAWAKSSSDRQTWLPLTQHLADTSDIAGRLFDHWLAHAVKEQWGVCFPGGVDDARLAFTWLAGLHDLGKMSPAFAVQVDYLAEPMRQAGLDCGTRADMAERKLAPHAAVSNFYLFDWLKTEHGWDHATARQVASVLGAHHGKVADPIILGAVKTHQRLAGKGPWQEARAELATWMTFRSGASVRMGDWAHLRIPVPVLVGMSGLLIVADWVASSEAYFPYRQVGDVSPPFQRSDQSDRVEDALAELAFPRPWSPTIPTLSAQAFYRQRFDWPQGSSPTDVQRHVYDLAQGRDVGLLVVETTTGSGKTEAALAAAEVIAARLGLSGLYFALPTQATSDGMFDRVSQWLLDLPEPPEDVPAWSLTLAHGKASLNPRYRALMERVDEFDRARLDQLDPEQVYDHDEDAPREGADASEGSSPSGEETGGLSNAVAHQWFRGRKRRLLASFAVGTIDQVLMAGLQSKHLMLRHLGLMGKVVIIDEAHASDAYMDVYLDRVLEWLGAYGVPVIVLSATLPALRRRAMVEAYVGRRPAPPKVARAIEAMATDERYPLITAVDRDLEQVSCEEISHQGPSRRVTWNWGSTDLKELVATVEQESAGGGCILIIRNTVGDAQRTAEALGQAGLGPITLNHSRFMAYDRMQKDVGLRSLFGPTGARPDRHVVVATQVAEQSLDVDFDLLITDLAPIDLLFQRLGRLHRHQRERRPEGLSTPRCIVLADEPRGGEGVRRGSSGSERIYGAHLLLRTAAVLDGTGPDLAVPDMVSPLVQRVFGTSPVGPPEAQGLMATALEKHRGRLEAQRHRAQPFLLDSWNPRKQNADLSTWMTLPGSDGTERRGQAMVRDTEPTLEVIVVPTDPSGSTAIQPPWVVEDSVVDVRSIPDDATARAIAGWTVRLPPMMTSNPDQLDELIRWLQEQPDVRRWEWHRHPLLRGELFLPMRLQEGGQMLATSIPSSNIQWLLQYSPDTGLEVTKDV